MSTMCIDNIIIYFCAKVGRNLYYKKKTFAEFKKSLNIILTAIFRMAKENLVHGKMSVRK